MPAIRYVRRHLPKRVGKHPLLVALLLAGVVTASAGGYGWVHVQPGDSVWSIAESHHTTIAAIVALNHLPDNGDLIYAGSWLRVPKHGASRPAPNHHAAPTTTHHSAAHGRHSHSTHHSRSTAHHHASHHSAPSGHWAYWSYTVKPGDSLDAIAAHVHVPAARIAHDNHLPSSLVVELGQKLRIRRWDRAPAHHVTHKTKTHATHKSRTHATHKSKTHATHKSRTHATTHAKPASALAALVARHRAELANARLPSRAEIGRMVAATAARFGVPRDFALAISWQESGFNQREVSGVDAIGAMQVLPSTGDFVATYVVLHPLNVMRAQDNITAGVGLLSVLLHDTHGNQRLAAAGYYQGLTSVRAHGMFKDTKQYVADVLALRSRF